jgi:MoaA/NifB/PqqE/SkfB family radical SAM enzyme
MNPGYQITARTVIHKLNFKHWPDIINCAKEIGLDQVSFLPADVSSHAFNREILWTEQRQQEILPDRTEVEGLKNIIELIIREYHDDIANRFIAENPEKLRTIYAYYAAFYSLTSFPYKKCNAPWVSTVVEADGTVRPCFFHPPMGNIRNDSLEDIVNSSQNIRFRKGLDMDKNETCIKCVCYLNLSPATKLN